MDLDPIDQHFIMIPPPGHQAGGPPGQLYPEEEDTLGDAVLPVAITTVLSIVLLMVLYSAFRPTPQAQPQGPVDIAGNIIANNVECATQVGAQYLGLVPCQGWRCHLGLGKCSVFCNTYYMYPSTRWFGRLSTFELLTYMGVLMWIWCKPLYKPRCWAENVWNKIKGGEKKKLGKYCSSPSREHK